MWTRSQHQTARHLLATRDSNNKTYFHHGDWLGTERARTDYSGNVANKQTSWAFGDNFLQTSAVGSPAAEDNNQFGGQECDTETGTDHATFRQYSPMAGRWMSPDPYDGSYDLSNPQSLNRYSYVNNNPFSATDPTGLVQNIDQPPQSNNCALCDLFSAIGNGIESLLGLGRPSFKGTLTPRAESRDGSIKDPMTETIGGVHLGYPKTMPSLGGISAIADALGVPTNAGCEFGARGFHDGQYAGQAGRGPIQYGIASALELLNITLPYFDLNDPNHRLFGSHYCGPGGGGSTVNGLDRLCAAHDACYSSAGASPASNANPINLMGAGTLTGGCDRQLCTDLWSLQPASSSERRGQSYVYQAFGCAYYRE